MGESVSLPTIAQIMTGLGFYSTLILFFIWRDWKREERFGIESKSREEQWELRESKLVERLQHLEDFTRTTLLANNEKTSVALAQNTTALAQNTIALKETAETSLACVNAINKVQTDLNSHHELAVEIARKMDPK